MTEKNLIAQILKKKSFLVVGLDVDLEKIPKHLLKESDPIFAFNKQIIEATQDIAVAYKPNIAFYESYGLKGWDALEKTIVYLNEKYPEIFTIADAKRADIGNTSKRYAKAFFENLNFDSITVNPYMGEDSVVPFLNYQNKHTLLLTLTSNKGSEDFQKQKLQKNHFLYVEILKKSLSWQNNKNMMYVVGATQTDYLQEIRKIIPHHFLLIPGVGAQGGDLENVCKYGMNEKIGLLINASRSIIYAAHGKNFAKIAREKAFDLQKKMAEFLKNNKYGF